VDNGEGILLSYSDGNVIENCQVQGSSLALVTVESSDNRMSNCSFLNGTLTMQGERNLLEHCDVVYGTGGKGYHGIITEGDLIMFHSLVNGFRTGILVESGNLDIMWSRITHNIDGIQLEAGTLLNAYYCDIVENQGTGIVSRNPQQIIIRQSRILYNLEDGVELGGVSSKISDSSMEFNGKSGVHVTGSECEISDSMITNNSVSGIEMENAYLLSISNCTIRDNRNGISGFTSSGYLISNSSILHNEQNGFFASEGSGGIVEYSTISDSINGIRLERTTAEIRWCTITDNTNGIYAYRPTSNVTVSHCTIMNNSEFGIGTQLYNAFTVNASHNYWGFPSGPFHSEENTDGRGNPIGDEVAFSPWYEDDQFDVIRHLEKKEDDDSGSDDADVIIFTIFIIVIPFIVMGIRVMKRRKQPGAAVVAAPPRKPGKNVKVVPEGLKLATVTSRIVASAFDGVIIVFILLLIFVPLLLETESADTFCGLMVAIYLIVPIEYFLFTEMRTGQSYGKNWARIRLVSIDGNPLSLNQSVRSALSKGFLYPFLNIVDAVVGIFSTNKKTMQRVSQDYAGLIVVTVREKRGKSDAAERPGIKHNGGDAEMAVIQKHG
jgi:parallel beta-helix repeat protein